MGWILVDLTFDSLLVLPEFDCSSMILTRSFWQDEQSAVLQELPQHSQFPSEAKNSKSLLIIPLIP